MQLFMAIKAFIIIWITLLNIDTKEVLDIDLEASHALLTDRFNQALAPFGMSTPQTQLVIPFEVSVGLLSFLGAIISFCIVNEQVKFAHFFYEFTENEDLLDTKVTEADDQRTRTSKRMQTILSSFVYTNFLTPIFLILVYLNPVIKQLVVPDLISSSVYSFLKYSITFVVCILRCLTFREEIQFSFNESYSLIQKLV